MTDLVLAVQRYQSEIPTTVGHTPEACHNRGLVYALFGEHKQAIADFETFLRMAPTDDPWRMQAQGMIDGMRPPQYAFSDTILDLLGMLPSIPRFRSAQVRPVLCFRLLQVILPYRTRLALPPIL